MPSPTPTPVMLVNSLPEWLTGVVIPVGSALLAAGIVFFGLYLDRRRRDQVRRAAFIDELTQVLISAARIRHLSANDEDARIRDGMDSNIHRVRAIAQMKRKEHPVYLFATVLAAQVVDGQFDTPQKTTANAIQRLLSWLIGDEKTKDFEKDVETTPPDR